MGDANFTEFINNTLTAPTNLTSSPPPDVVTDEDFSRTVARFGLSVLIVGCVLLGVLGVFIFGHRLNQQRRARQAMARRLQAGEGQYTNPGELLEEEEQVAQGGVLVIHTEDDNPKERLRTSRQRRLSDYEATASSMAKYVHRNSLPQATV